MFGVVPGSLQPYTPTESQRALVLTVLRQPGTNAVEVADGVKELFPSFNAALPPTVKLNILTDRAATIREHGPDSVAFYVSGQLLTEDYYVFNKLAKGLIGTANIDTNSRLCMSSAVTGYVATLGADAPPACYEDIDHAACLFIAGSNTAFAHPVLFRRIEASRERNPDLKIVVVDPRRTDTARFADLHLAILPGTDGALAGRGIHRGAHPRLRRIARPCARVLAPGCR